MKIRYILLFLLTLSTIIGCKAKNETAQENIIENSTINDSSIDESSKIYVSKDGLDTNSGSKELPLKTINRAVEIATDERYAIYVTAEEYREPPVVIKNRNKIIIKGGMDKTTWSETSNKTTLKGEDDEKPDYIFGRVALYEDSELIIKNFVIERHIRDGNIYEAYGISNDCGVLTVDNCDYVWLKSLYLSRTTS